VPADPGDVYVSTRVRLTWGRGHDEHHGHDDRHGRGRSHDHHGHGTH